MDNPGGQARKPAAVGDPRAAAWTEEAVLAPPSDGSRQERPQAEEAPRHATQTSVLGLLIQGHTPACGPPGPTGASTQCATPPAAALPVPTASRPQPQPVSRRTRETEAAPALVQYEDKNCDLSRSGDNGG